MSVSINDWYKDEICYCGNSKITVKPPSISRTIQKECPARLTFKTDGTNTLDLNYKDEQELFFISQSGYSFFEKKEIELEISTSDGIFKGKGQTQFLNRLFRTQEAGYISIDWDEDKALFESEIIKEPGTKIFFFAPITNLRRENLISWKNSKPSQLLMNNQTWFLFYDNQDHDLKFYIQPLPDISGRLLRIRGQSLATAFIAGETSYENLDNIPYAIRIIRMILSLSSGRNIGIPFFEIRDSTEKIIKRIHLREQYFPYLDTEGIIIPNYSTQKLISLCISSIILNINERDEILKNLDGYIDSILFANNRLIPLKYKMTRLLVAFEDFCDNENYVDKKKIVDQFVKEMNSVNFQNGEEKKQLEYVIRNCSKLLKIKYNFQDGLNKIIKKFSFNDKAILDKVIKKELRNCNSTNSWDDLIRQIRNSLVHEDSFPCFLDGKNDFKERVYRHFMDFFIRTILSNLNFMGKYHSFCNPNTVNVDWVRKNEDPKKSITAKDLGFI